jgi:hypothetical protein
MKDSPIGEYYQHTESCIVYKVKNFATYEDTLCVICLIVPAGELVIFSFKTFFSGNYKLVDPQTLSFNRVEIEKCP